MTHRHAEGELATKEKTSLRDGDQCVVVGGTHKGKSGIVRDIGWSKAGHVTITVVQSSGVRLKTLGRNVSRKP